ncbi:MAG TPA: isopentenyl phosphate kinase family protein [Ignisphaera sp.]|uniref:Isopentenyl phosphate kinase n=1 Tax=Ignisphaera aggregans TaxID=334771 RepID=A0A833DTV2_9CREN|nr:isopentenyl phosphate kinase family protein [Ignisphaera sp.]HIP56509.1 isopentenyl phosphate kinase family protein [Ignisphaera aggregans]
MVVVVKIGGALITDKQRPFRIRYEVLRRLAKELAQAYRECCREMVLIHGGGSYGHYVVHEYGSRLEGDGFYVTIMFMRELNRVFVEHLHAVNVPAVPVDTHAIALKKGDRLQLFLDTITYMLKKGYVPVLYGDVVVGDRVYVLSGDEIAWFLARELQAKRLVFVTEVLGVFDKSPEVPGAKLINEVRLVDVVKLDMHSAKGIDVTGGMATKLRLGLVYRPHRACEVAIIGGTIPENVYRTLCGHHIVGTRVRLD